MGLMVLGCFGLFAPQVGLIPKELGGLGQLRNLSLEWNKLTGESAGLLSLTMERT